MTRHDIIVIGTSAGGVPTLQKLLTELPRDLPAAVFIVMHLTPHAPSFLAEVLSRPGRLPITAVHRQTKFRPGHVYVAPPDHHILLTGTEVRPARGPRESWHRPSIDVLFRSAAHVHGPRVVGVILTGFLDDGAAGLAAIKRNGGLAIVQDPEDAEFPDMPMNALQAVNVDSCVPVAQMAAVILRAVEQPAGRKAESAVAGEVAIETGLANMSMNG